MEHVNSTGLSDLLAREHSLRLRLVSGSPAKNGMPALPGFSPMQVQPHTLDASIALKNGKNNYSIDFGEDGGNKDTSLKLLSKDDMFAPVGASLRVGKTPVVNGEPQYSMTVWTTYPSAKVFAGPAVGGATELNCIRALMHGSLLTWKSGSEELIYDMISEMLCYTPDTQEDPANGIHAGTGATNDLDRFRILNKDFAYLGGKRNHVIINIPNAETTALEDAVPANFINLVGIQLHGLIIRGGADPVYANSAKGACCNL